MRKEINDELENKKRISRALERSDEDRHSGERELTPHVVTRYYRAPELIMKDKNYNYKIDVWSVGAIFLELLQMK